MIIENIREKRLISTNLWCIQTRYSLRRHVAVPQHVCLLRDQAKANSVRARRGGAEIENIETLQSRNLQLSNSGGGKGRQGPLYKVLQHQELPEGGPRDFCPGSFEPAKPQGHSYFRWMPPGI